LDTSSYDSSKRGSITESLKAGVIMGVPKITSIKITEVRSPITQLNRDYGMLGRAIANIIQLTLTKMIDSAEYKSAAVRTVLDVTTFRDAIGYRELTGRDSPCGDRGIRIVPP
jgi:hypothetical protein